MRALLRRFSWFVASAALMAGGEAGGALSADLAIYDVAKGLVINIATNRFREVVLDASPRHSSFFTLTRLDAPKLIMRERSAEGRLLSETELPIFLSGYAWPEWIKLSPDRKHAIFWSGSTKGLSLLSLEAFREKELIRDLCKSETRILLMRWLSDKTVLVLVHDPLPSEGPLAVDTRKHTGRIVKLDVDSAKAEVFPYALGSSGGHHALSESRELLAVAGEHSGESVRLLDVRTMRVVKELPLVSRDQWICNVKWVDGDKLLALWNVGDAVYLYSLPTGEAKRLTAWKDYTWFPHDAAGKYLVLRRDTGEPRVRPQFFLHDVTSGKRTMLNAPVNGRVYSIAQHTKLVMEVGY